MTLDFVDGMNLMALFIGVMYVIMSRQSKRCTLNVDQFNTMLSAILVRQSLLAKKIDIELPSLDVLARDCKRPSSNGCVQVTDENGDGA